MKGLKKLALVTAVAAAPFAQAEMTAMDDALLGEMTGQAGITIDVDLAMTIDAIKYVDRDGNNVLSNVGGGNGNLDEDGVDVGAGNGSYEYNNEQGAITLKGLTVGSIQADGSLEAARIRGITIDADGTDGLVIGLNQIGDDQGNGIDITVDAVIIGNGNANLNNFEAVNALNAATLNSTVMEAKTYTYNDAASGVVSADLATSFLTDAGAAVVAASANVSDAFAVSKGYIDSADLNTKLTGGSPAERGAAASAVVEFAAGDLAANGPGGAAAESTALLPQVGDLQTAGALSAELQSAGKGNIGGFKIENFRNYIENDLVEEYNGVFDMALRDSAGVVTGNVNSTATGGRFVRGEIVVNGTGNAAQGTSGLKISGTFGGALDQAAWVDEGNEFGIEDLGFFNGVDTDSDGISDTIEGMHFTMNIDVVQHESWDTAGSGVDNVAALQISGLEMEGTIMMGSLYLDGDNTTYLADGVTVDTANTITKQSLGSVLIKDIDMTGTSVYVYGH